MSQFQNNFAQILQSRMDKRFQSPSTWGEIADPDNQQPQKMETEVTEEGRRIVHSNYVQMIHWPVITPPPEGFDPDIQKLLHEAFLTICEAFLIPESLLNARPVKLGPSTFYVPQPNKLSKKDEPTP